MVLAASSPARRAGHADVNVFRVEALGHRGEARDVREHHGDRLPLALEGALRGEDLVGQVLRRVGDGSRVPERGASRGRRSDDRACWSRLLRRLSGGRPQAGSAFAAELLGRVVRLPAGRTGQPKAPAALATELVLGGILRLARWAGHCSNPPGCFSLPAYQGLYRTESSLSIYLALLRPLRADLAGPRARAAGASVSAACSSRPAPAPPRGRGPRPWARA
jgi:hypothetical protein